MRKEKLYRAISHALIVFMLIGTLGVSGWMADYSFADETSTYSSDYSIRYGQDSILEAIKYDSHTSDDSHIWFGDKDNLSATDRNGKYYYGAPYWRILDYTEDSINGNHLLLMSEYVWSGNDINDTTDDDYPWPSASESSSATKTGGVVTNVYQNFKNSLLSSNEMVNITDWETDVRSYGTYDDKDLTRNYYDGFSPLSRGEIEEYLTDRKGYRGPINVTTIDSEKTPMKYHLRTVHQYDSMNMFHPWMGYYTNVSEDGRYVGGKGGIRPGVAVGTKNILFISPAKAGKNSGRDISNILQSTKVCRSSDDWKLTLKDSSRNSFSISNITMNENKVTLHYDNAKYTATLRDGSVECVSAVIKDEIGNVTYYGRIKEIENESDVSGTAEIDLTDVKISEGDTLYVFSEQYNGDYRTDYASELRPVLDEEGATILTPKSGIENEHFISHHAATNAGCTTPGNDEYWVCDRCATYYKNEECTEQFSDEEVEREVWKKDALGHKYSDPVWTWSLDSEDNLKATALFTCSNDRNHTVTIDENGYREGNSEDVDGEIKVEVSEAPDYIPPTCTEYGQGGTMASVSGLDTDKGFKRAEYKTSRSGDIEPLGHDWAEPTWTWTVDEETGRLTSAKAHFVCNRDDEHTEDLEATGTNIEEKNLDNECQADGLIVYTAKVKLDGHDYTGIKTTEINADEHTWGEPSYKWSDDGSLCIAQRTCSVCNITQTETATITSKVTKQPTVTEEGETTYTASFTEDSGFTSRTKTIADIPAKGPGWGEPEWNWEKTDDGYAATATFTDNEDPTKTKTVTAEVTKKDDGTYTAAAEIDGFTYTSSLTVTGPEESNWDDPVWNWEKDGDGYKATATFTSKTDPTKTEIVEANVTGNGPYKASATLDGQTYTSTLTVTEPESSEWNEPSWSWEQDENSTTGWKATANFTSKKEGVDPQSVLAVVTVGDDDTFIATAKFNNLTYSTTLSVTAPATSSSNWNDPTWSWEKDENSNTGWKATATFKSITEGKNDKIAEAEIAKNEDGTFKATVKFIEDEQEYIYTSTLAVAEPESSKWNEPTWSWAQNDETGEWTAKATFTSKDGSDSQPVDATITENGDGSLTAAATIEGVEYSTTIVVTTPKNSDWKEPTWKWEKNGDDWKVTATFESKIEGTDPDIVKATVTGDGPYTATATTKDGVTYSTTLDIQDPEESEWGDPVWNWNKTDTGYEATATFTSNSDPTKTRTVDATVSGDNPYTATVTFAGEKYTTSFKVENADDSNWNDPSWKWEKDSTASSGWRAVATFTNESGNTDTETATITGSNPLTATVEHNGRKYTSTLTIEQTSGGGGGSGGGAGTGTKVDPEVEAVKEKIDALSAADKVTIEDKDAIEDARKAYDALTDEQKKEIDSVRYKKLTDVEYAYAGAKDAADKEARENQTGEDGTALGRGASFEAAEKAILGMTSDADPAGSKLMPLKVKSIKQTKKSVKVQWSKPTGAVKYVIYGNKCGKKNKMKRLKTTTKASINFKKIASKKVKKGTSYKFIVVALDKDNNVVSTSKVVHAVTKGSKKGNPTKLTVKSPKSLKKTLTVGKSFTIKSKISKKKRTKTYLHVAKNYKGLRYESSNPAVAKVSKSGKITAVSVGTTNVIVYTQNGISKTVKVTVK